MLLKWFPPGSESRTRLRSLVMSNPFRLLPARFKSWLVRLLGVFHPSWYVESTDAQLGLREAALHFARNPAAARAGNPMFDADWYRTRYGFAGDPVDALLHFAVLGDRLGLYPVPWFDTRFFRQQYGIPLHAGALAAYMRDWRERPMGHPLFDNAWYLRQYPDVRQSGQNPLEHFVQHGLSEGRKPNAYFDQQWYLDNHPDIKASGLPAALHFCLYGAHELRSPGPNFDAAGYAVRYASVLRGTGLDPLSHFLTKGRDAAFDIGGTSILEAELTHARLPLAAATVVHVDVVIPVYGGYEETRACIESVIESHSFAAMRLHLYNDASPEPEITRYLRELVVRYPQITLVENPQNLGFVGTVNSAMRAVATAPGFESVLLLNSDTIVAGDWVERITAHARQDSAIATVTALSNNATICSYPNIGSNDLAAGLSTADVDRLAAQCNAGLAVDVPTGVGFCMLITSAALDRLGFFDHEAFGRGYGEEVDFCRRAIAAGMRNVLAMDVFVRHVGEVSFADSSHPGKAAAARILNDRYPDFSVAVGAFVNADPALLGRLRLTFARWHARREVRPVHVLITHALGGGTERHVQEVVKKLRGDNEVVVIRPSRSHRDRIRVEHPSDFDPVDCEVTIGDPSGFARLLTSMGTGHIQIHHVLGFGDFLREGIALSGCEFDFMVHDYYSVCPQVNLIKKDARYCGELGLSQCDECISERHNHGAVDIRNWRIDHEWMILGARELAAPSHDAAQRIQRYLKRLPVVRYHEPMWSGDQAFPLPKSVDGVFRIGVIGVLAPHKGRRTVLDAARFAATRRLPLHFHVIGDTQGELDEDVRNRVTCTGVYEEQDLARLIDEANLSGFLFAAPWPETYSYTISAAIRTGLPIIATNLGAFPERLAGYPNALLLDWQLSGAEVATRIAEHLSQWNVVDA